MTPVPLRQELPKDLADWTSVQVDLPRLSPDSAESCPIPVTEVMDYVRLQSADLEDAKSESLAFVRTAAVAEISYWLWTYTESFGEVCYVLFRKEPSGETVLGLTRTHGLSPEQYILADYYDEIYFD